MTTEKKKPGGFERVIWWVAFLLGIFVAMYAGVLLFWPSKGTAKDEGETAEILDVPHEEIKPDKTA